VIVFSINVHDEQRTVLAIVLEKDNLERMKQGDPATLESVNFGGVLPAPAYWQRLSILIAYLEDSTEFYEIARRSKADPVELLRYLEKNRQWRPEVDGLKNAANLKDFGKHSA
jgi:hypothetical protein